MPTRHADDLESRLDSDSQTVIFYEESQVDNNATFIVDTHRSRENVGVYKGIVTAKDHQDLMSKFGTESRPQGDYGDAQAWAAE